MSESIAFIGFGEAGQTISRGLVEEAAKPSIRAYDILFGAPAGARLEAAAKALGVGLARDHVDAVHKADMVMLTVTASSSLEATRACLPGLLAGYMIERAVTHGRRRAAEMREVSETLQSIGMEPLMAAATARRQQWVADLGVKAETEDRAELVSAIRAALGR